ncbi:MAG: hypothetical protein Q9162_007414 [Coniocarpon cinnabarinum]
MATTEPISTNHTTDEITSLCMTCHQEGTTRLLLTRIPFFREVLLSSFSCPHCHTSNTEIQSAGEIQPLGLTLTFTVSSVSDLQRQIVKGDHATVSIPELELEIPKGRGQLTNLEGLLSGVAEDLESGQRIRREVDERVYEGVKRVVEGLKGVLKGERLPVRVVLEDATGNSSIEPVVGDAGKLRKMEWARSREQNQSLGIGSGDESTEEPRATNGAHVDDGRAAPPPAIRPEYSAASSLYPPPPSSTNRTTSNMTTENDDQPDEIIENQIYELPTPCPACHAPSSTATKLTQIPHFGPIILMSLTCTTCGYRSNEVKSGGSVPDKGRTITLHVKEKADLNRDVLKSESCALRVPELGLDVATGTLGGRFSTVEGLLMQIRDELRASVFDTAGVGGHNNDESDARNDDERGRTVDAVGEKIMTLQAGDSMAAPEKKKWQDFFAKMDDAITGRLLPLTVELQDPLAGSYVQSLKAPEVDEQIQVVEYVRSTEEEEELGLRDMVTEGYEGEPVQVLEGGDVRDDAVGKRDAHDGEGRKEEGSSVPTQEGSAEVDIDEIQRAVRERLKELGDD